MPAKLAGGPQVNVVGPTDGRRLAASQRHQLTVRVPPDQHHVVQPRQPIQDLHRLRPGRVVTAHHDPVSAIHVRLSEHRIQHRQDAMDVGQNGDGLHHEPNPARRRNRSGPSSLAVSGDLRAVTASGHVAPAAVTGS